MLSATRSKDRAEEFCGAMQYGHRSNVNYAADLSLPLRRNQKIGQLLLVHLQN
ncbi:hypothetical protein NTGBS_1020007 [Candidatus Nitrotoga sp. BS]|nr:hypothetical protein NTGBS_1020007 [Candidatus Nitrotoga sp. BS]